MAIREELIPVVRERLWNRALFRDSGCIEYLGASITGYGCLRIERKGQLTHRLMWEVERGPIPATGHYSNYAIQRRWYPQISARSVAEITSRATWKHI